MLKKPLFVIVMFVVGMGLAGCGGITVVLMPEAVNVRTIRNTDAGPEYIEIETITVNAGTGCFFSKSGTRNDAMILLRNRAAELGGTLVRIERVQTNRCDHAWWITGTVYKLR